MTEIETEEISLDEIYQLAFNVFSNHTRELKSKFRLMCEVSFFMCI